MSTTIVLTYSEWRDWQDARRRAVRRAARALDQQYRQACRQRDWPTVRRLSGGCDLLGRPLVGAPGDRMRTEQVECAAVIATGGFGRTHPLLDLDEQEMWEGAEAVDLLADRLALRQRRSA